MLTTRNDMIHGAESCDRPPATSPTRNGRACGSRMRCLPDSRGWTWAAHLKSLVAAAVLAVSHLVLPTASADAACETSKRMDLQETEFPCASWKKSHRSDGNRRSGTIIQVLDDWQDGGEKTLALSNSRSTRIADATATATILDSDWSPALWVANFGHTVASRLVDRLGEHLTDRVRDLHVTLGGLRNAPWRSREEGEPAAIADIDGERWRDWTWDSFAPVADDGSTRTGPQETADRDLLLGSSFLFTAGDSATSGSRGLDCGQAAPMRFAGAHGASGDGLVGLFGDDCERRRLLAGVAQSYGVGEGGYSAADRDGLGDSLSGVYPYVPVASTERLSVWSVLGYATHELTPTEGSGDGSERPFRPGRTVIGMPLAALDRNDTL